MDMQNGVAIVTGASSGVGAACAEKLAELGCHVVINYSRNEEGALTTESGCKELGVETRVVQADVGNPSDCQKLADAALDAWGRIDALINNAGTTKFNPHQNLEGLTKEDFLDIYSVNTVGPYMMTRAVVPAMQRGQRGSIVNVSSIAGVMGVGSSVAYAASKGALNTMTLSLARVLGPHIRVNTICPGFIQGEWLRQGLGDESYEASLERVRATTPLQVASTPEQIADGVLYFITGADVVTGETLILDGGAHLATAGLSKR
ncbi:MAG: glucose 1-dehydrogenase [Gammaproteobacteria bacterium]|nr:glucose 1-dehydrogenase [Gammaproteobacteria bacterium]